MDLRRHRQTFTAAVLAASLCATGAAAETLTNTSGASFTVFAGGAGGAGSVGANVTLMTGVNAGEQNRSAIVFDVPAGADITSATLRINSNGQVGGPNTLALKEMTSPIATILGSVFTDPLWDDLADGLTYGSRTGVNADLTTVEVTLNADGLAALNAARGGRITFGLINQTIDTDPDYMFASSAAGPRELVLVRATPVPTMTEWAMITLTGLLAAAGAVWAARQRRFAAS